MKKDTINLNVVVLSILLTVAVFAGVFIGGCRSNAALRTMSETQQAVLVKYLEVAGPAIQQSGLSPEKKEYYKATGEKLLRNQATMTKLSGGK